MLLCAMAAALRRLEEPSPHGEDQFEVAASLRVEMRAHNTDGPYVQRRGDFRARFSLQYASADDVLPLVGAGGRGAVWHVDAGAGVFSVQACSVASSTVGQPHRASAMDVPKGRHVSGTALRRWRTCACWCTRATARSSGRRRRHSCSESSRWVLRPAAATDV